MTLAVQSRVPVWRKSTCSTFISREIPQSETMEHQTTRINGSMLPDYDGRNVCILGIAKDIDSNGTSFVLKTSDNTEVKVIMEEPLNEYVSDLTEVHGPVKGKTVICHNYLTFPKEASETFDMSMYNSAVEFMARAPQLYSQGMSRP